MKSLMRTIHAGVYAERLRRLTDVFVPLLLTGDRVLDVGCGNGFNTKMISKYFKNNS